MKIINYIILIIVSLLLVSCGNNFNQLTNQAADFLHSAEATKDLEKKNNLLLAAAEALIEDHNYSWAEKTLAEISTPTLTHLQFVNLQILSAKINLIQNNTTKAKELLSSLSHYQNLNNNIYKKLYSTKIDLFLQSGEIIEAIQEQINLEDFLTTNQEIIDNQKSIWNNLQQLTPSSLELANQGNFSNKMQGWISLAIITKKYDTDQNEQAKALLMWQQTFSNHPANNILNLSNKSIINNNISIANNNHKLNKIALLLPISGPHKKSALAIKNGFLAALYNKKSEYKKPKIMILDTNERSIINTYKQAITWGADFIIGPLLKKDLENLIKSANFSIPILALNRLSENHLYSKLLFQFGLPPETESITITEKAWENHHKNALFIIQDNELGKRIHSSLSKSWQEKGGNILNVIQVNEKTDLPKVLNSALGIEDSNHRAKALTSLGIKFNFDPRRRQDLDCIFLITNSDYARQIKPLLNFYYASKIPIYASSNIYTGIKNPLDRDLDHIQFCDMPWILDNNIHNRLLYQSITKLWNKDFAQYSRLYAMGIDSYKIATQLPQLLAFPEIGVSGMTGILKLNSNNVVSRTLMWGVFENGKATILNQKN